MPSIKALEGKEFYIKVDGKQRKIGEIANATVNGNRTAVMLDIKLTNQEIAGILGAAQDKSEAAESPIGMSDAEIDAAISVAREDLGADPGPFVATANPLPDTDPFADDFIEPEDR